MDDWLLRHVADAFREYGFEVDIVPSRSSEDGVLHLVRNGRSRAFPVRIKLPLTLNSIDEGAVPHDTMYVTDRVSTRTADALRRLGVSFVDGAGNAFVDREGWYVDVRGRRGNALPDRHVEPEAPTNLYSAKRSQVIFALLTWPELLDASVRSLAHAAGVSVGIAQSTSNELRRRGLWPDHEHPRSTLIEGWAAAFPDVLARSLTIRRLHAEQLEQFYGPVLVSGEAAPSAQMRARSAVVYVDDLSTELLMMNRWRTDGAPNITARRRFWSHGTLVEGEAPALLVYGDLRASDDPRTRAVATEYGKRL